MAREIHHVPGRLRLRSAITRRLSGKAQSLAESLSGLPGVHDATVSPATGSLTIRYDPVVLAPELIERQVGEAIQLADRIEVRSTPHKGLSKAGAVFGKAAFDVFVAKTLERSVVSVLAALR